MRTILIRAFLPILALTACGSEDPSVTSELSIVATTSILADIVKSVVGDAGTVEALMGPGVDPHDFQPSARQAAAIREADLVVANGLGLEEGMTDVLAAAVAEGAEVLELAPKIDPIVVHPIVTDPIATGGDSFDPHFWLDPLRVAAAAELIAERISEVEPEAVSDVTANLKVYKAELERLNMDIVEILSVVPVDERNLVTNHDTLGYLAERYGFQIVGVVIPGGSTLAEPSAAGLAALAETVRSTGAAAIFTDTSSPATLATAVAAEVGDEIAVVSLPTESLGPPDSSAADYPAMMRTIATAIADALTP